MARYRSFRDLDGWLLIVSLVICALGVLQIYSATHDTKWHDAWWKQMIWIVIGLGLMWVVTSIDYHTLLGQVPLLYSISIAALLLTFAVGDVISARAAGSDSDPGHDAHIQISEFEKMVIILLVARYLSELKSDQVGLRDLLKLGVLVGIPTLLVMEPAGLRDGGDVPADSGRRGSVGRDPMALSGDRHGGVRAGAAGGLVFSEGLPEGAGWSLLSIPRRIRGDTGIR